MDIVHLVMCIDLNGDIYYHAAYDSWDGAVKAAIKDYTDERRASELAGSPIADDTQFLEKQLSTFGECFVRSLGYTYYVTSLSVHTGE